ncbi:exodeoxyribonuclease V subunit beta [Thiolapillus sp.]
MQPLDVLSLPLHGHQLIEASAGTGKTFSITRIYLRLLLEKQLDVRSILVMTFTRAATEELRGRIAAELRQALDNWGNADAMDDFYREMNERFPGEQARPLLHRALLYLDEAPVFTIHSFCRQVLLRHAFATGLDFDTSMEQELGDLHLQAVRDWYRCLVDREDDYRLVAHYWPDPGKFLETFSSLLDRPVRLAAADPGQLLQAWRERKQRCRNQLQTQQEQLFALLIDNRKDSDKRSREWQALMDWLDQDDDAPMPREAAAFLHGGRWSRSPAREEIDAWLAAAKALKKEGEELRQRLHKAAAYGLVTEALAAMGQSILQAKQAQRVMGFEDLVARLAAALDGASGQELAGTLAREYPAALVDEFQDTDPLQYQILQRIYTPARNQETALYLIGDPKQAIYAFRGGDVFAYLRARADADSQWHMDTNWRSSTAMVQACNRLFHGAPLDQAAAAVFGPGIDCKPVKASGKGDEVVLRDDERTAALQLVHFPAHENYAYRNGHNRAEFRAVMAQWCAAEIARLLGGKVVLGEVPLQAKDIVVLVRNRTEAEEIKSALDAIALPSVYLSLHDKLFASEQAGDLYQALLGILELEDERLARAALASAYFGGDAQQLHSMNADEDCWEQQHLRLQQLRRLWQERGFVAMALTLLHHHFRPPARERERALTNSLHLVELLQQASQRHASPRELLNWLGEQIRGEGENIEAELRLETDADLLRIQTQHGAKGLEYPVVFIPFASRYKDPLKSGNRKIEVFSFHDRDTLEAVSYLGWDKEAADLTREESHAESVRLLYVAVTRAVHRCYIGSTVFWEYEQSPLGQVLGLSRGEGLQQALELLAADAPEMAFSLVTNDDFGTESRQQLAGHGGQLAAASFHGRIQRDWWLGSFSALTRNQRHGGITRPDRDQAGQTQLKNAGQLRFALPAGAAAGNLLHDIFEHLDFSRPDWNRVLQRPLACFGALPDGFSASDLVAWLQEVLHTPLSPELTLSQLEWPRTLRETAFYFPMLGGNTHELGRILAQHRGQDEVVELPVNHRLQGMMHGYIDLIFEWRGRYYVADYKSNYLGGQLGDYSQQMIEGNMRQAFYDLQYLLYSLALHRYLQARLENYQPAAHFGGVYYLYLRGMSANTGTGVYHKPVQDLLLAQLDALFGRNQDV